MCFLTILCIYLSLSSLYYKPYSMFLLSVIKNETRCCIKINSDKNILIRLMDSRKFLNQIYDLLHQFPRICSLHLIDQTPNLTSRDTFPTKRPHLLILPKLFYYLVINHSNIWAYGSYSHSNHYTMASRWWRLTAIAEFRKWMKEVH